MYSLAEFARKYQVDALEQEVKRYLTSAIGHHSFTIYAARGWNGLLLVIVLNRGCFFIRKTRTQDLKNFTFVS